MKKNKYNVAVVGATGAVGNEMISILEKRKFPIKTIKLLASNRSAGSTLIFKKKTTKVELLTKNSFKGIDLGLFSAGGSVSKEFAPHAAKAGCVVIDNTSAFRMDSEIPLVVPEVNPHAIAQFYHRNIIANPNCSTIQMVVALKPIHDEAGIKRIVVSTYQAVSGTGKKAIDELVDQTKNLFNFQKITCNVYPHQIAFNCLPHIDVFLENGYTKEEVKMIEETKKIMEDNNIKVTATTVRVPVFCGHSESVNIETRKKITPEDAREILNRSPGVTVVDDPKNQQYPLAVNVTGTDDTFVGRIRTDESVKNGLNMWVVADNLRKGAALNAVQIAELLVEKYL